MRVTYIIFFYSGYNSYNRNENTIRYCEELRTNHTSFSCWIIGAFNNTIYDSIFLYQINNKSNIICLCLLKTSVNSSCTFFYCNTSYVSLQLNNYLFFGIQ